MKKSCTVYFQIHRRCVDVLSQINVLLLTKSVFFSNNQKKKTIDKFGLCAVVTCKYVNTVSPLDIYYMYYIYIYIQTETHTYTVTQNTIK